MSDKRERVGRSIIYSQAHSLSPTGNERKTLTFKCPSPVDTYLHPVAKSRLRNDSLRDISSYSSWRFAGLHTHAFTLAGAHTRKRARTAHRSLLRAHSCARTRNNTPDRKFARAQTHHKRGTLDSSFTHERGSHARSLVQTLRSPQFLSNNLANPLLALHLIHEVAY